MDLVLLLVSCAAVGIKTGWAWAGNFYQAFAGRPNARAAMGEILNMFRPFYLPAVAVYWGINMPGDKGINLWIDGFCLGVDLLIWVWYRNLGDDDRWKRRKRKAVEAIRRVGARLVVQPVGSNA